MSKKFTDKQIHILDVAEELIAKKGFKGTSVREISSKANVNVAMISYYFGSKEKMLAYLYQYRVQRARANLSEFAQTIIDGKPEMQMKEIIKFVVNQMFHYSYFHGFVRQEFQHDEVIKDDLLEFYHRVTTYIDAIVKKGVATGVFHYAPKSEDILVTIIGAALFAIRNENFYKKYIPDNDSETYLQKAQAKVLSSSYQNIFSLLGYQPEADPR
ncbi:transcriptional regulator, TetR family [Cruoricaptor ignavus]|uniref:TetR/AcrR family transcriptional regulator n=1 Tax=Cruoricaptor ignavus TaxID=1118202 RepID=A0A1M6DLK2_9FLAO|nr:TetR family transcriptional regulator [Cruoricaptor ignavus]QOR73294.1 TetR/AcrR family transcriptional regulator [Cruoricaptor ignavus]SHI74136.1 transcriptional regulator, TetR family [Cruoricaptor ignavus]